MFLFCFLLLFDVRQAFQGEVDHEERGSEVKYGKASKIRQDERKKSRVEEDSTHHTY